MFRAGLLTLFTVGCSSMGAISSRKVDVPVCTLYMPDVVEALDQVFYVCSRKSPIDGAAPLSWTVPLKDAQSYFTFPPEALDEILK